MVILLERNRTSANSAAVNTTSDIRAAKGALNDLSADAIVVQKSVWDSVRGDIGKVEATLGDTLRGPGDVGLTKKDAGDMQRFVGEIDTKLKEVPQTTQLESVQKSLQKLEENAAAAQKASSQEAVWGGIAALITALTGLLTTVSNIKLASAASRREDRKLENELQKEKQRKGGKKP
jgi:hypothetical protein